MIDGVRRHEKVAALSKASPRGASRLEAKGLGVPSGAYWTIEPNPGTPPPLKEASKSLWESAVRVVPTDKQAAAIARRDVKRARDSGPGLDVVFVFIFVQADCSTAFIILLRDLRAEVLENLCFHFLLRLDC